MLTQRSIVLLGATGFVGHHLLPRLAADGHRLTLLTRNRTRHRELALVPGIRLVDTHVHDVQVLTERFRGADVVINLVGILNEQGGQTFDAVHVRLAQTVIRACQQAGVARLHQMSSLKAGAAASAYLRSRGAAEDAVRISGLDWTIYRPSVIFGPGDGLVSRFHKLLRTMPVLPLARAGARMAPVFVGDVADAVARCVGDGDLARNRCLELPGPDTLRLGEIVTRIRDAAGLRRAVIALPDPLGWLQAAIAGLLPGKPFSLDNFRSLGVDSVSGQDGLGELGITPLRLSTWLAEYFHPDNRQALLDRLRRAHPR